MINADLCAARVALIQENTRHDILDLGGLHAAEDLKFFIFGLLPDGCGNEHLRETIKVEAHSRHVELFVDIVILVASESHSVGRVEGPMTVSVAKIDLINQESHREGAATAEEIIFIPNMDMLDIQLDTVEEGREEGKTDGLLKLLLLLLTLLRFLFHALLTLSPLLRLGLSELFAMRVAFYPSLLF